MSRFKPFVFSYEEQTERVEVLLFYSSEPFTFGHFLPVFSLCIASPVSASASNTPYSRVSSRYDMSNEATMFRESRTAFSSGQIADQTHFVLGKLMTVSYGTLGLILFPGSLCHERLASVFPAYVIFSSDFTFLEECVRNYIFNNISHRTLT